MTSTTTVETSALKESLDDMVISLHTRLHQLQSWMKCRHLTITDGDQKELSDIDREVTDLEKMTEKLDSIITKEEKSLEYLENMIHFVSITGNHLSHMRNNLPKELPTIEKQQWKPSHTLENVVNIYQCHTGNTVNIKNVDSEVCVVDDGRVMNRKPIMNQNMSQSQYQRSQSRISNHNISQICLVTNDELNSVPKYIRHRVTQQRVNDSIIEFNALLRKKYELLLNVRKNPSKLSTAQFELHDRYCKYESEETKHEYWLMFQDFKEINSKLFTVDQTGKTTIQILRHLQRIKMIPGKTPKYAVL